MKSILIYSGGLDSTVLLYKLAKENSIAEAVSINYGQKQKKELEFAKLNCEKLKIPHLILDISNISALFGKSALTNIAVSVPRGEYSKENMASTVVPNRNMIFLSLAAARAMALGCDCVAYAAHSGDHALYADCTNEFAESINETIKISSSGKVELCRPFINMDKKQIVKLGKELGVDFSLTWSCYNGGDVQCGKCATCVERNEALNSIK